MRPIGLVLASALVAVVACSAPVDRRAAREPADDPSRPLPTPLPDVVARINGQAVTLAQILPLARRELEALPEEERVEGRPAAVRRALGRYIDRELLFQEARNRGLTVDARGLEWAYDQLRREHPDDGEWEAFLAEEGLTPRSLRTEIRIQHTVTALLEEETADLPPDDRQARERVVEALVDRLRARARIETYL